MPRLYANITGITSPLSVSTSAAHNTTVSMATIQCISHTLDIGSAITVDLGYTDNHAQVFTGYVKSIERQVKDNIYVITAYDKMIRAVDYFMVSSDPNTPFTRRNIAAENLVRDLMAEAGLTDYDSDPTFFTLGHENDVEVNLVSVHDFCKMIGDALTWNIWADSSGTINFKNRKPYVMSTDPGQPGWVVDTPVAGITIQDSEITDLTYKISEKDLRNRVVVYGLNGIHAEASEASPYLPEGFYKSVVASFSFIDGQDEAEKTAAYNLDLLNRLTTGITFTTLGNTNYNARNVYTINVSSFGLTGNWYCYSSEHSWSRQGYQTTLEFRGTVSP